jgi:prevent-host-death family protein
MRFLRLVKVWSDQAGRAGLTRSTNQTRLAQYNTYEAKALLSELLRRVRRGEEIVIAHAGHPVAKLVPYRGASGYPGVIRARLIVLRSDPPTDNN